MNDSRTKSIDHDIVKTVVNIVVVKMVLNCELRAQSQEKDTVIVKLKEQIKSLKGNVDDSKVKMDMDEIETLNIELEHRRQKLEFPKNELRKLKGKALDKEAIKTHSVDPKVSKDNVEPITPKLLNKRTAHSSYIKHTQEEAFVLRDIVEHVKANYPHDSLLKSAFRYTKVIQELLSHIRVRLSTSASGSQLLGYLKMDGEKTKLLDEFAGELTRLQSIPPGIDNINLDPVGDILFLESLLYDNSSPRPPEDFHAIPNTIIESLPTFSIPVEDSDFLREEIDIFPGLDDSIPPGIESDDFDSEDDDNSTSRPEFESFHVDYPDSGDSTIDVVEDIPVDVPNILPTHLALQLDFDFIPSNDLGSDLNDSSPSGDSNKIYDPGICIEVESTRILATLPPVIDTLLTFSSENEDKVFNHGVLASKEKSPSSPSHRGFKASKVFHQKSPMLIHGDNTPDLGVRHPHFYPP
ncbi:hypothetical protein Tco_0365184 [Tanacetum coccineum]